MGVRSAPVTRVGRATWFVLVGAAALALALGPTLAAGSTSTGSASSVRPHPFVESHISVADLPIPPTTAECQALFGLNCYQPAQMRKAYNLQPLYNAGLIGAGRTIVIVDSFGSPTIEHDLHVFDSTFGLPDPPSFKIIQPAGPVPPFDPSAFNGDEVGWGQETSLDVEWSHAIAPGANILLVETPTDETEGVQGFPEMIKAENFVIDHNLGDVISQSFGATEETFPNKDAILDLRSAFKNGSAS